MCFHAAVTFFFFFFWFSLFGKKFVPPPPLFGAELRHWVPIIIPKMLIISHDHTNVYFASIPKRLGLVSFLLDYSMHSISTKTYLYFHWEQNNTCRSLVSRNSLSPRIRKVGGEPLARFFERTMTSYKKWHISLLRQNLWKMYSFQQAY